MRRGCRTMRRTCGGVLTAVVIASSTGCGSSPITAERIENAIAPTFANLVHLQVSRLALPPMAATDFEVIASCRRVVPGALTGAGEWECTLRWLGPDRRTLRDKYEVVVAT